MGGNKKTKKQRGFPEELSKGKPKETQRKVQRSFPKKRQRKVLRKPFAPLLLYFISSFHRKK
jgi:hypothetical protein